MKLFLDTADIEDIRTAARWGVLDGVTTNPSLFAKTRGESYESILGQVCALTSGPVSAEGWRKTSRGCWRKAVRSQRSLRTSS
jgi:transaldolase